MLTKTAANYVQTALSAFVGRVADYFEKTAQEPFSGGPIKAPAPVSQKPAAGGIPGLGKKQTLQAAKKPKFAPKSTAPAGAGAAPAPKSMTFGDKPGLFRS